MESTSGTTSTNEPSAQTFGWPRRLLHVPTMISVERTELDSYLFGNPSRPAYNILSYTWGRWRVENASRPALIVHNAPWQIPVIDGATAFSVAQLTKAIHAACQGDEYLWLDVACVDQRNGPQHWSDLGDQWAVFHNARNGFIWLHQTPFEIMQSICDRYFQLIAPLEDRIDSQRNPGQFESTTVRRPRGKQLPTCLINTDWLARVALVLTELAQDPWFSSVWTLQEAYLKSTALLLSREGFQPTINGTEKVSLAHIVGGVTRLEHLVCESLHSAHFQRYLSNDVRTLLETIESLLTNLGLGTWGNLSLLYISAGSRRATLARDYVYGIMQAFGFRLGRLSRPRHEFSLDELETLFANELNKESPIWGQLFVHRRPQCLGTSWRINRHACVPHCLKFTVAAPSRLCEIRADIGHNRAIFQGDACPLWRLNEYWRSASAVAQSYTFWGVEGAVHAIFLDGGELRDHVIPPYLREMLDHEPGKHTQMGVFLASLYGARLSVCLLGSFIDPEGVGDLGALRGPDGANQREKRKAYMGLLVLKVTQSQRELFQRIGICVWAENPIIHEEAVKLWSTFHVYLG